LPPIAGGRAFLDADVLHDPLTANLLLALAEQGMFRPLWSRAVLDSLRRHRRTDESDQRLARRIELMNLAFPKAFLNEYDGLTAQLVGAPERRPMLAAALHVRCRWIITNSPDAFETPTVGAYAVRIERLSWFLPRSYEERPSAVMSALAALAPRNDPQPRSISSLIGAMATRPELRPLAHLVERRIAGTPPSQSDAPDTRSGHEA
jgi:hypothetical protein